MVHCGDMTVVVTQQQGAACAVVDALNAVDKVITDMHAIVIGIADGNQSPGTEVIEACFWPLLGKDQFTGSIAQINRRLRKTVGDSRALFGWHREADLAVFVVRPQHAFIVQLQTMRQGMAPAMAKTAVDFDRTASVKARPLQWQQPTQLAIGEGQQFLASHHRNRVVFEAGFFGALGGLVSRVFRLIWRVVDRLFLLDTCDAFGFSARLNLRIRFHFSTGERWLFLRLCCCFCGFGWGDLDVGFTRRVECRIAIKQ